MNIDIDEIKSEKISNKITKINLKLIILDYEYLIIDRLIDRLKI
jgi:hypothetical protein